VLPYEDKNLKIPREVKELSRKDLSREKFGKKESFNGPNFREKREEGGSFV